MLTSRVTLGVTLEVFVLARDLGSGVYKEAAEGDKLIQILTVDRVIPAYIRARLPIDGRLAFRWLEGYKYEQVLYKLFTFRSVSSSAWWDSRVLPGCNV